MQVFNARTQQDEDVVWGLTIHHELIATFKDGGFVKFPAGTDEEGLKKLVVAHKEANQGQEVVTDDQLAEQSEAEEFVNKLNGGTPKGDKTDAPTDETNDQG